MTVAIQNLLSFTFFASVTSFTIQILKYDVKIILFTVQKYEEG